MNERIRELAEKCYNLSDIPEALYYRKFDEEKFVELLVKEFVFFIHAKYERDFDKLWRKDLTDKIKEHFGVEE